MQKNKLVLYLVIGSFLLFLISQIDKENYDNTITIDTAKTDSIKNTLRQNFSSYSESIPENGKEVVVNLTAEPTTMSLTGDNRTEVWSYNGQVPGPEIRAQLGDRVTVHVTNNLPQPTTIHWHGVRVPSDMDGVPVLSQQPIQPGDTFTYSFVPKDAGTFWYHPHVRSAEQVERGLYGTLVIEDPSEPQFDSDTTLVIDDWRILEEGTIDPRFTTPHDLSHDGRWGNLITVNGEKKPTITLDPGSTNRIRLVNTSNGRVYKLHFGSLNVQAIAVDGMKIGELFNPQGFELAPGNRLDVLASIPGDSSRTSFTIADIFTRNTNPLITIESSNQPVIQQAFEVHTDTNFPDWSAAVDLPLDHNYILDAQRGRGGMGMMGIQWSIDGKVYPDYQPLTLNHNEIQKIRFTNKSSRLHPMHLHGQFFQVVSRNGQPADEPYWRDTVLLRNKEIVDIVLLPLDKGNWANHCHILEHAEAGMMTVVKVI